MRHQTRVSNIAISCVLAAFLLLLPGLVPVLVPWATLDGGALSAHAAEPVTFSTELAHDRETAGGIIVLWIDPAPEYHAYAHEPGVDTRPTVVSVHDRSGTPLDLPVLYMPGEPLDDPFTPGRIVNAYGPKTPVFVKVPALLAGGDVIVRTSLLLCSDRNCQPVRHDIAVTLPGEGAFAALPDAASRPWRGKLAQAVPGRPVAGAVAPGMTGTPSAGAVGDGAAIGMGGVTPTPRDAAPGTGGSLPFPSSTGVDITATAGNVARGEEEQAQKAVSGIVSVSPEGTSSGVAVSRSVSGAAQESPAWSFAPRYFAPELEVSGLGKALLLGLLAGLILNVMPCVLPVISLKLSGFIATSGAPGDEGVRRRAFREHNLFFAAGILVWFVVLAGILAVAGLAWGQLFQRPGVLFGLTLVVFTLGLSMFGVFSLPVLDLKAGTTGSPRAQAFMTGVVATLLATPCSGPLLGGVLGWAFRQPSSVLALVFAFVGLGMASPYLLMAARPGLVRFFPRPGAWTGVMEQVVGFFLMATSVYLLTILPAALLLPMLVTLLVAAFAAWLWGTWAGPGASSVQRIAVRCVAVALVGMTVAWALSPPADEARWEPFEATAFRDMLGRQPVIVDFTADWCPNCKLLERTTLNAANMARWQKAYGARLVRVDLTRDDPVAQALLHSLGSSSIPVVALFPTGLLRNAPLVLRDLFTADQMDEALERAFGPAGQPLQP